MELFSWCGGGSYNGMAPDDYKPLKVYKLAPISHEVFSFRFHHKYDILCGHRTGNFPFSGSTHNLKNHLDGS